MINCINCNELINVSEKDLTCPICGVLQNITETQVDYFSSYYKQSKRFGKLSEVTTEEKRATRAKAETPDLNEKIINELIKVKNILENTCKVLVNKYNVHHVVEEYVKYLCKLYINGVITTITSEDEDNTNSNAGSLLNTTGNSRGNKDNKDNNRNINNNNISNVYAEVKRNGVYVAMVILYTALNNYYYKLNLNNLYKIVYVLGSYKNNITKKLTPNSINNFISVNNTGTSDNKNDITTSNRNSSSTGKPTTTTDKKNKGRNKPSDSDNDNLMNSDDNDRHSDNTYYYNKVILDKYNNLNKNSKLSLRLLCRSIISHFKLPSILYSILDKLVDYYYYCKNGMLLKENKVQEEDEYTVCCALVLVLCRLLWPIFHFQPPSFPCRINQKSTFDSYSQTPSQHLSHSSNTCSLLNTTGNTKTNSKKNNKNKWNSIKLVTSPDNHRIKMLELKKYIIDNFKNSNFNSFIISIIYKYINNYFLLFKLIPIFNSLNSSLNTTTTNNMYYSLLDIDFSPIDSNNRNSSSTDKASTTTQSNTSNSSVSLSYSTFDKTDYSNNELYCKIVNTYSNLNFSGYSFEKSLEFNYFIFFTKNFKRNLFKNLSNIISNKTDNISDTNNPYNPVINKLISCYENKITQQTDEQRRKRRKNTFPSRETQGSSSNRNSSSTCKASTTTKSKVNLVDYQSEKSKLMFQQFPSITRIGHTLPPRAFNLRNSSYHGLPVLYLLLLKSVSNFMGVPIYKLHGSVVNIESLLINSINNNSE